MTPRDLPLATRLIQLSEECVECAQAALKLFRAINGDTPVTQMDAKEHLIEEIADVSVCMTALHDVAPLSDVGEIIAVSESTLYPILKRLESGGLVTVNSVEHNGRLRKYYRITKAGEQRIRAFLDEWRELMRALARIEAEVEYHG